MNIFACDWNPVRAAVCLPSKLIVKMPLETCQMLATNFGPLALNWGTLPKKDGTPYGTKGFLNHPCTVWARSDHANLAWLILHGLALTVEYTHRYKKMHGTYYTLASATDLFEKHVGKHTFQVYKGVKNFVRAMPEPFKSDTTIDDVEAYRRYLRTKTYAEWDRRPEAKPKWW